MRIGIFSDRYLPLSDGICTSIESFRIELEALGHEVYVFAPKPSWRYKPPSNHIIFFAAVKGLFFEDYLTSFFFPPQAIKQIEKLNLDIIHYQTPGPIGLLGVYYALKHRIPLVTTYHTDLFEYVKHYRATFPGTMALSMLVPAITGASISEYRQALSSIKPERDIDTWHQKILVRSLTLVHDHCDLVITPSPKIETQLKSWHTKSRIVNLQTGVDKITTTKREVTLNKKKYGLQKSDQIILFVGRVGTEKNLTLLMKAFTIVAKRSANAKLVIVGGGDDLQHFRNMAIDSPYSERVVFTGWIDRHKLGAMYEAATVFAFPSLSETQGLTTSEAAWAGLPIVLVDPNVTQVVIDGQNGYIAKNSARDFASKILKLLDNDTLRARMASRGIELASKQTASKQAAKLLRLYEETVEKYGEKTHKLKSSSRKI
jgi:glycosyltransferase involved in cell wall biosynthesis